jgi:hypothetical protein
VAFMDSEQSLAVTGKAMRTEVVALQGTGPRC